VKTKTNSKKHGIKYRDLFDEYEDDRCEITEEEFQEYMNQLLEN